MSAARLLAPLAVLALGSAAPALADHGRTPSSHFALEALAIDETKHLGSPVAADLALIGEDGGRFALGELFGKPLLLLLSYYSCDGACPVANRVLAEAIGGVKRFRAGEDFRVLTLSFDAKDDLDALRRFADALGVAPATRAGWRFALAAERAGLERLTGTLGYRYFWSVRDRVFVHPAVLVVISPEGRVARYLPAASIGPRDIELAMIEADWGKPAGFAGLIDLALGACFSYSYKDGRYVLNVPLFAAAGSLTLGVALLILSFSLFGRFRRKERRGA